MGVVHFQLPIARKKIPKKPLQDQRRGRPRPFWQKTKQGEKDVSINRISVS